MILTTLDTSCAWNNRRFGLLHLAYFNEINVLKVHPHCRMWQYFSCSVLYNIPSSVYTTLSLSIHLIEDTFTSWLLWIIVQWLCMCKCLSSRCALYPYIYIHTHTQNNMVIFDFWFFFVRNLHTVSHNGCTVLHCHQQYKQLEQGL